LWSGVSVSDLQQATGLLSRMISYLDAAAPK